MSPAQVANSWALIPASLTLAVLLVSVLWAMHRHGDTGPRLTPQLTVLATAPDPGNPGQAVVLLGRAGSPRRWVDVRNGTAPHTRYRLPVEDGSTDPIAAVAATYGLTAEQYRTCARRS